MCVKITCLWLLVLVYLYVTTVFAADDDYNVVHKDGSFEFGYNTPDSYHYADGDRRNVVKGEFGSRNPSTGSIDSTVYTAGPRGFRPRGKNVARKYDLNQNGPRPVGSPDDPYYDPYEDPSYSFGFRTRTQTREESANRLGDVNGRYSYLDDVGERHNVEYIAGKRTGFHVKTPFPDSNPRAYGPLYFNGRGKPIPRGRTSIQRGLDGSYRFVSAGPDQRRTEVSDATGHVRGSYTYLDDKGVQHSVHYIAGPETGYRVLKQVKGPHLPTVFPFGRPEIIPADFYDYGGPDADVFDTAASGRPLGPKRKPGKPGSDDLGNGINVAKDDINGYGEGTSTRRPSSASKPISFGSGNFGDKSESSSEIKPGFGNRKPGGDAIDKPSFGDENDDFGDLFDNGVGGSTTYRPSGRPGSSTYRPKTTTTTTIRPVLSGDDDDDGSYKTTGEDGSYKPDDIRDGGVSTSTTLGPLSPDFQQKPTRKPGGKPSGYDGSGGYSYEAPDSGLFGSGGTSVVIGGKKCSTCSSTIVTNVGDSHFSVPPGGSVRAHVQSIDLLPFKPNVLSPSEQLRSEIELKTEQLNEVPERIVTERASKDDESTTEIPATTVSPSSSTGSS